MPILTITISIDVDIDYFEKKTDLSDQQIAEKVCEYVKKERDALASEARIAAIYILSGEEEDYKKDREL